MDTERLLENLKFTAKEYYGARRRSINMSMSEMVEIAYNTINNQQAKNNVMEHTIDEQEKQINRQLSTIDDKERIIIAQEKQLRNYMDKVKDLNTLAREQRTIIESYQGFETIENVRDDEFSKPETQEESIERRTAIFDDIKIVLSESGWLKYQEQLHGEGSKT